MKQKRYASIDEVIEEIKDIPTEDLVDPTEEGPRLISVQELRAAGALDVPPAWRKSLGTERDLFSDLSDDEGVDNVG